MQKKRPSNLRTWVEIDKHALHKNVARFLKLIGPKKILMAVIKSNAYGHGIFETARILDSFTPFSRRGWFGVDSCVEGIHLRERGVQRPILVLGHTPPVNIDEATRKNIILTVSNFEILDAIARAREKPTVHIKIDTGMHRQGFLPRQIPRLIRLLNRYGLTPAGIYTHFASAKDSAYPTYTAMQFSTFRDVLGRFQKAGFKKCVTHAAASGGALLFPDTHADLVRVGMSLYGYHPSMESRIKNPQFRLCPVLSWKTIVSELKEIPKNSYVGYDLTERVARKTRIAVLPIGYWHGYDRGLSSVGEVLLRGKRAKLIGRVSMDMIVVDTTDIPGVRVGDEAVLIGRQGKEALWADEVSEKISTTPYEFLTRINPRIKRVVV